MMQEPQERECAKQDGKSNQEALEGILHGSVPLRRRLPGLLLQALIVGVHGNPDANCRGDWGGDEPSRANGQSLGEHLIAIVIGGKNPNLLPLGREPFLYVPLAHQGIMELVEIRCNAAMELAALGSDAPALAMLLLPIPQK